MDHGPFIDGLPIKNKVIFNSYVSLPEDKLLLNSHFRTQILQSNHGHYVFFYVRSFSSEAREASVLGNKLVAVARTATGECPKR